MKLSNKILIGFFGFIFLYLTAIFAEVRFRGNFTHINDSNSIAETVDLTIVSYLILSDLNKSITIIGSDQPRIEVRSFSGDLLDKLKYNISGDTLSLSQLDLEKNETVSISIFVSHNGFSGMTVNGAVVNIKSLEQKELSIVQNAGQVRMDTTNRFNNLHLELINEANFYLSGTDLDTLSAVIDNSEVIINSSVRVLEGSINNNAYLRMKGSGEIQLKKDKSSSLYLN